MLVGARKDCVADAADVVETMTTLKALDYDFFEIGLDRDHISRLTSGLEKEYRDSTDRTGLPVRSTSFGFFTNLSDKSPDERQQLAREVADAIEFTRAVGGDAMLLATQETGPDVAGQASLYRELLTPLADRAAAAGVTLALEHVGVYKPAALTRLVRAIDHPAVRIYFDMGNCLYVGEDPLTQARICGPQIAHLHIKGGPVAPLAAMPLVQIRKILQDAGFDGRGCLEIAPGPGNLPLKEARGLLKMAGYIP